MAVKKQSDSHVTKGKKHPPSWARGTLEDLIAAGENAATADGNCEGQQARSEAGVKIGLLPGAQGEVSWKLCGLFRRIWFCFVTSLRVRSPGW